MRVVREAGRRIPLFHPFGPSCLLTPRLFVFRDASSWPEMGSAMTLCMSTLFLVCVGMTEIYCNDEWVYSDIKIWILIGYCVFCAVEYVSLLGLYKKK